MAYQHNTIDYEDDDTNTISTTQKSYFCFITIVGISCVVFVTVMGSQLGSVYSNPEFQINSMSVSPFNVSNIQITATSSIAFNVSQIATRWNITFDAKNPNINAAFSMKKLAVTVWYKDQLISTTGTAILPFYLGLKETKSLSILDFSSMVRVDESVRNSLLYDIIARGAVEFNLKVKGTMKEHTLWSTIVELGLGKGQYLESIIEHVMIAFSSNSTMGKMIGGSRKSYHLYTF